MTKKEYMSDKQYEPFIETNLMRHLIEKAKSDSVKLEDLTLDGISKAINVSEKDKIQKVLSELDEDKIISMETNDIFYLPREYGKAEIVKKLKLQKFGHKFAIPLIIGWLVMEVLFTFINYNPFISLQAQQPPTSTLFSVYAILWGFVLPFAVGNLLLLGYSRLMNLVSRIIQKLGLSQSIDRVTLKFAASVSFILEAVYVILSMVLNRPVTPFELVTIFGLGFGATVIIRRN